MRGKNTENREMEKGVGVAEYQGKRYVIMKFTYKKKHIVFNPIGTGRRKKEICNGIKVIISLIL